MNPQIVFLLDKSLESLRNSNLESAERYLKQALRLQSNNPHVLRLLGVISAQRGQYSDALKYLNNSLIAFPKNCLALSNLGNVFLELKEFSNALDAYDKSIKIDTKYYEAWSNKGNALYELKRFDEAVAHYDKALSLKPDYAEAWGNKGFTLKALKCYNQAIANFNQAISLKPDYAEARNNRALLNLFLKKYQIGWEDYNFREKTKDFQIEVAIKGLALWSGSFCKHLFVFSEQGVGDIIFYASVLEIVKTRVGNITISIDARLLPIFTRSFPGIVFIDKSSPLDVSVYDAQIPFGSLPIIMNMTPNMIGRRVPYLIANPLTEIQKNKPQSKNQIKCGVAWRSSNSKIGKDKSILLSSFNDIFKVDGYEFINLQYGNTQEEIKDLEKNYGVKLITTDNVDLFEDIDGLLSLIESCDVIVTTSNVTAHLAGALGKTTFLLVPYSAGRIWYWHEELTSSWYPSVSLYSQDQNFKWNSAIKEIASVLKNEISKQN
jgi:hypothetical protein